MMNCDDKQLQRETDDARGGRPTPRIVTSDELLAGEKEVLISHHGEVYRLRETRNGKLILGK